MSLCHLYFKTSTYQHIQEILNSFENSISLDINETSMIDDYDVYIIELEDTDQNISSKLRQQFTQKLNSLVYFIVPQKHNLMFFQLSNLLNAKHLVTQSADVKKFIKKITKDKESHEDESLELLVGRASVKAQSFMIFKNMNLEKVSAKLLEDLEYKNFKEFQTNISSKLDIQSFLEHDGSAEISIPTNKNIVKKYKTTTATVMDNTKVVFMKLNPQDGNKLDFISSRVTFIELLKEKLLQRGIVNNELSAITINIENIKKLQKELSVIELEDLLMDLLNYIESILQKKTIFAQIKINFFVILFDNISFQEINNKAHNFNTEVTNHISTKRYKPSIDIYTFNLNNLELLEVLSTFDNIKNRELTQEEISSINIKHIRTQETIDEKGLLDNAFKYSTKIKILNIYHGLVISTPSKILKVTKDTIYISFESLQGVVINIEKSTVLQSPMFPQDIIATAKKIDLKRKIVVLEGFKFLKTNANSRRYSRVTTASRTPISVLLNGITINGYILDLSIKSIAIKVKHTHIIDSIKTQKVSLSFNISNTKSDDGFSRLNINANVINFTMKDLDNNCKIICDIDEDCMNDSILMQYIYERQKELIIELKKTAQLH